MTLPLFGFPSELVAIHFPRKRWRWNFVYMLRTMNYNFVGTPIEQALVRGGLDGVYETFGITVSIVTKKKKPPKPPPPPNFLHLLDYIFSSSAFSNITHSGYPPDIICTAVVREGGVIFGWNTGSFATGRFDQGAFFASGLVSVTINYPLEFFVDEQTFPVFFDFANLRMKAQTPDKKRTVTWKPAKFVPHEDNLLGIAVLSPDIYWSGPTEVFPPFND